MDSNWSSSESLAFVEGLYADFLRIRPRSAPSGGATSRACRPGPGAALDARPGFAPGACSTRRRRAHGNGNGALKGGAREVAERQDKVDQLVRSYRVRGHAAAHIDPLERPREPQPELELAFYGLSEKDLERPSPPTPCSAWSRRRWAP
jgi:2-oxoglutarate dehydrogenase E1 component